MNKKKKETIFVVSKNVALNNSKVNWPDMNYPGMGETILRIVHKIDYEALKVQLDGENGPWFSKDMLPEGVGFYEIL